MHLTTYTNTAHKIVQILLAWKKKDYIAASATVGQNIHI